MDEASTNVVWYPLRLRSTDELKLEITFKSGQSFRWKKVLVPTSAGESIEEWWGVIGSTVYVLREDATQKDVFFSYFPRAPQALEEEQSSIRSVLVDYLQLHLSMDALYQQWSSADSNFKLQCANFKGLRLLRQDPTECLFSFICSQNNNIGRITKMIDALCERYGSFICTVNEQKYFQFPKVHTLASIKESELRELGFGYRAKYIVTAAKQVIDKGENWLESLRKLERDEVQQELVSLMGIGPKVADCIALFSLDKLDVVPVDTHVWQIAQKYLPKLKNQKLNKETYGEIGNFFRQLFGKEAGWAHSLLFAAELSFFQDKLPTQKKSTKKRSTNSKDTHKAKKRKSTK